MARLNDTSSDAWAQLVGVPRLIGFESPGSWLSRAALSQGVTPGELLEYFGVCKRADPDLFLTDASLAFITSRCGLPAEDFAFAMKMFDRLKRVDPEGKIFLLRQQRLATSSYCPVCLYQLRVKHLMVHWRFQAWRYCPLHGCMMEDRCRACGEELSVPAEMLLGGPQKEGIAYLDHCMACGHQLSAHWKSVYASVKLDLLSTWARGQLGRGRALLSALHHGKLKYQPEEIPVHDLSDLLLWERMGLIPKKGFVLSDIDA